MSNFFQIKVKQIVQRHEALLLCMITLILYLSVAGCSPPERNQVQGYVEGEFVYVASPFAGALRNLHTQRGDQVAAGDPLFTLESASERDARNEAEQRLKQARANLEDEKKGRRPTEIEAIRAQILQAEAALVLSEKEFARRERLLRSSAVSAQDVDRARATRDQDRQRIAQLEADLKTARLGSRSDRIAAAESNVRAQEAALARAQWDLSQKRQAAPETGLVFDTLYREGEWVGAGRPVVVLLPPRNIKVRAFVPETILARLHQGDKVQVFLDGLQRPLTGKLSFVSPKAEYTPPVIFSRESRSKLVFMIEVVFDPETAARLHPGQPVDVRFGF